MCRTRNVRRLWAVSVVALAATMAGAAMDGGGQRAAADESSGTAGSSGGGAEYCPGDLNGDGVVDVDDLFLLLSQWGPCDDCNECPADLTGDCEVGVDDLFILLGNWSAAGAGGVGGVGGCAEPPDVLITKVIHTGEPAPGIPLPGTEISFCLAPQIDGAGNLLARCLLMGPHITSSNVRAIFHGRPGEFTKLVWESEQAPDMPAGVTIKDLFFADEHLAAVGTVSFSAILEGPGITPNENDVALFAGPPDDIRKVIRTGDPAPGLPEGVSIRRDTPSPLGFGGRLSDNGTLLVLANLTGDGVEWGVNDRAIWTGPPDDLQLVWRRGDPAPGTWPGVTFAWSDLISFNDAGEIAFRGGLTGPGIIQGVNDRGRWVGGPGDLRIIAWAGMPAPGLPKGTTFAAVLGGSTTINAHSDVYAVTRLEGPDVTPSTDTALYAGQVDDLILVAREGDHPPGTEEGVEDDGGIGHLYFNNLREAYFRVRFRGPSIDDSNRYAMYYGPPDNPALALRDGEPAPYLPAGTVLALVGGAQSVSSMNDIGGIVAGTEVSGPGVDETNHIVIWMRDPERGDWFPILRGGDVIGDRTVSIPDHPTVSGMYCSQTGGSDGERQSLNSAGQFVTKINFTDETHGIYLIETVD